MPSSPPPKKDMPDKELALWMLERIRESEEFLSTLREARVAGSRNILDIPNYVERHKGRLAKLFQSDTEDDVAAAPSTAAKIAAVMKRDLLSSPEEFIEKALAAYLEKHPRGNEGLGSEWQTTLAAARDEIEGRTTGVFKPNFVADLAAAARVEMDRQSAAEQVRSSGREGRES